MPEGQTPSTQPGSASPEELAASTLTPALVREVTDKVYALLLADLRIERERRRRPPGLTNGKYGGHR
jgi:hypothetical protein